MDSKPLLLNTINDFLKSELHTDRYLASEQGGIDRPSERPITRIGVALEPFPALADWLVSEQIDALWLHRPWQLNTAAVPPDVGLFHHHLPFDETLTIGYNSRLAAQLGVTGPVETLGYKQATTDTGEPLPRRPIGMLLNVANREFDAWLSFTKTLFGGYDRAEAGRQTTLHRVAVVGAMTDALVREAAGRGANLYLTGQYRKPAQEAVDATGIAVIAVGHRRSEEWGLRALADLLRQYSPDMTVVIHT